MRPRAAAKLGIDYESLRRVNPAIVYCHTRGFEHAGTRADCPGNDQTGAALTGIEWEDGAVGAGGRPFWSLTSFGDTGNGFLSAIVVIQALYHRARTGEGQLVDTSIVNAGLLNTSYTWKSADGASSHRPHLDAEQLGFGALYRLYPTANGWLCLSVLTDNEWTRLCGALGEPIAGDARFATAADRRIHDGELADELAKIFETGPAATWCERLDEAGVPCEISSPTYALDVFDDTELLDRGWVASYEHPVVGRMEQHGLLFDFSDTPGRIGGPPLVVGDHTVDILEEHGFSAGEIREALDQQVVMQAAGTLEHR
jgi:crotonobetainyl-CoA:carnitine CoA-transferase CaiB-like acyl-CoA transferase